jgi:hypothetical protein
MMTNKIELPEIDDAIIDSIADPAIADLAEEIADLGLDSVLAEGPLQDAPIIGWLIKIGKAGNYVKERFFRKKVIRFLTCLNEISKEERQKFHDEMNKDKKSKRKHGEELLILLERLDFIEKVEILAKAFSAYIQGKISRIRFQEFAASIERCFPADFANIVSGDVSSSAVDSSVAVRLSACGLLEIEQMPSIPSPEARNIYRFTKLGSDMRKYVFGCAE